MPKHVIDKTKRRSDGARLQHYAKHEAEEKASPQARELQTRARDRKAGDTLKEFTKIERRGES